MDEARKDRVAMLLATGFGSGRLPKAPGTWGTLAAALAAPLVFMPFPVWFRMILLVGLYFLGVWAAARAERRLGEEDPGQVVIDEWLGVWLAYAPFHSLPVWGLLLGFGLFRLFDIWKPGPIRLVQSLGGGHGVMLDDLMAGMATAFCIAVARLL